MSFIQFYLRQFDIFGLSPPNSLSDVILTSSETFVKLFFKSNCFFFEGNGAERSLVLLFGFIDFLVKIIPKKVFTQ